MNANELKAKARERLAEIAKQRAALDAEEREIRVMLGDVPPAPTVNPLRGLERLWQWPPDKYEPGVYGPIVTCENDRPSLTMEGGIPSLRTTGCAIRAVPSYTVGPA